LWYAAWREFGNDTVIEAGATDMSAKKTVLIIDDDVDILEAVKLTLGAAGYNVLTASGGQEGLDLVRKQPVNLVILDVMMARDTEGFHVAQEIKDDPKLADTPILMMTSVAAKSGFKFDPKTDGEYMPVDDYVEKPVDPAVLVARVKKLAK
jgi:DNA-binding response OmpR family regulator